MKQETNPKVVQERLGHNNISVTLDVYSHVVPGMQELAAMQFAEAMPIFTRQTFGENSHFLRRLEEPLESKPVIDVRIIHGSPVGPCFVRCW